MAIREVTDMRQKLGTAIDPRLLARVRLIALQEKKHLNEVIEAALEDYLANKKRGPGQKASVVQESKGSIPADVAVVKKVLAEEAFFET